MNGSGSYSLYLQDRFFSLAIDGENKRVNAFDGELTFYNLEHKKLNLPKNSENVVLCLETNDQLISGSGGYIEFNDKLVLYDRDTKILQIGDIDKNQTCYKFLKNAYSQISKDGRLQGILFCDL